MSDVEDHRTPGTVITRIWRNEPGALELLVGRDRYREDLAHGPAAWTFGLSVIVLAVSLLVRSSLAGFHPAALIVLACLGMVGAPITFVLGPRWPIGVLVGLSFVVFVVIVAGVGLAGPGLGESVAVLPAAMSLTWLWFTRRWAVFFVGLTVVGYAVIVATRPGYSHAAARWIFVAGMVVTANALIGWVIVRIRRLAEDERRASAEVERLAVAEGEARMVAEVARAELEVANDKLARWTRTLEDRVEAQVNEIEGLNRLRRFLSPQVAEAVLRSAESGDDSLLRPHRRQIAVVFCDLRGFTSFASNAEPEEVVDALDSYYTVVGQLLHRHQATVGSFAGDGIMAYFNDPVPCDDPADRAVSMALDLAEPMAAFLASWSRRGFDLGYGVGIAYGYATLGTIGFEGRNDYTAVGSVVNLAARLCAEATPGEVLIDSRTHEATGIRTAAGRQPQGVRDSGRHLQRDGVRLFTPRFDTATLHRQFRRSAASHVFPMYRVEKGLDTRGFGEAQPVAVLSRVASEILPERHLPTGMRGLASSRGLCLDPRRGPGRPHGTEGLRGTGRRHRRRVVPIVRAAHRRPLARCPARQHATA